MREAFGVDPLSIKDPNELAELMAEAIWLKQNEREMMESAVKVAMAEVLNAAFGRQDD